jgi:hypothetical protein
MLDDPALIVESKDVHSRPVPILVRRPHLVAVQDDVIAFRKRPHELHALARVFTRHLLEVRDKGRLAIRNMRVVLDVLGAGVPGDGVGRLALVV